MFYENILPSLTIILCLCWHIVNGPLFTIVAVNSMETISIYEDNQGGKHEEHEEEAHREEQTRLLHDVRVFAHQIPVLNRV